MTSLQRAKRNYYLKHREKIRAKAKEKYHKPKLEAMNKILTAVCFFYNIPQQDLFVKSRATEIVLKRQVFMYLAYYDAKASLNQISDFIKDNSGNDYNNTTILHARNTISDQKPIYKQLANELKQIRLLT